MFCSSTAKSVLYSILYSVRSKNFTYIFLLIAWCMVEKYCNLYSVEMWWSVGANWITLSPPFSLPDHRWRYFRHFFPTLPPPPQPLTPTAGKIKSETRHIVCECAAKDCSGCSLARLFVNTLTDFVIQYMNRRLTKLKILSCNAKGACVSINFFIFF